MIEFINADIFDVEADGLASSGNVNLNMSGGVNGALLVKYGGFLQDELHTYLKENALRQVEPGFVYLFQAEIPPYKAVTYSVAIDGWYESSISLVSKTLGQSVELLVRQGCQRIATCAMGTGFGKLSKADFGKALRPLVDQYPSVNMVLVERNETDLDIIQQYFSIAD